MSHSIATASGRSSLAEFYQQTLLHDVMPFWLRYGPDREYDGIYTCLDRNGAVLDTDKSIWLQARSSWMFSSLCNTVEVCREWFDLAGSCIAFVDKHGYATDGHVFFTVTREGKPLKMRRNLHGEAFNASAHAAYAKASGDHQYAERAQRDFNAFLDHAFEHGYAMPKIESTTRPAISISPLIIGIEAAQELRANLGHVEVAGRSATEWVDRFVYEVQRLFFKSELNSLLDIVTPEGELIDHFEGRMVNPSHGLEYAWLLFREGHLRHEDSYIHLGQQILDGLWKKCWDQEQGGIYHFRDVLGKPPQEYWHDMKLWSSHCEALMATAYAYATTGKSRYAAWFDEVHEWSFAHFPDPDFGEWYGYLHRDGSPSVLLKGNLSKGPFHLPRTLSFLSQLLRDESSFA